MNGNFTKSCSLKFGEKSHSNLEISRSVFRNFPKFYHKLFFRWGKYLSSPAILTSIVPCHSVWFNKHINVGN